MAGLRETTWVPLSLSDRDPISVIPENFGKVGEMTARPTDERSINLRTVDAHGSM